MSFVKWRSFCADYNVLTFCSWNSKIQGESHQFRGCWWPRCLRRQITRRQHDDVMKWKYFRVTGPCEGNPPVTCGSPAQRPVTWSFDISFDLRLNKRLNKWPRRRWFATPSRSLWRHCNDGTDNESVMNAPWSSLRNPVDTWRNNNVIITSKVKTTLRRCLGIIMTLLSRYVSAAEDFEVPVPSQCWAPIENAG